MTRSLLKLLVVISTTITLVQAQNTGSFSYLSFNEDNGLSASDVYGVAQDSSGYIWVGSSSGLFRFDGTHFEHFGRDKGIHSRLITRIYHQADNSMILIGELPDEQYVLKDGKISLLGVMDSLAVKGHRTLHDRNGVLWAFGKRTSELRWFDGQEVRSYTLPRKNFLQLFDDSSGGIFISSQQPGYYHFDGEVLTHHVIPKHPDEAIQAFETDPFGRSWAIGTKHIFLRNENGTWESVAEHSIGTQFSLKSDHRGRLWIKPNHTGLYVYDPQAGEIMRMDKALGIQNVQITYLFQDAQDNFWISTAGYGMHCILNTPFTTFTSEDGLSSDYITSLHVSNSEKIWVGTNSGLTAMTLVDTGKTSSSAFEKIPLVEYVHDIDELENGTILCTSSRIVSVFAEKVSKQAWELCRGRRITTLDSNRMFVGNWDRYFIARVDSSEFDLPVLQYKKTHVRDGTRVNHCFSRGDTVWVLYGEALVRQTRREFDTLYTHSSPTQIQFNHVTQTSNGDFWIASSTGMIHLTDSGPEVLRVEDGLASNHCQKVILDSRDGLWIGTDKGLCHYLPEDGFRIFTRGNGLPSNHITELAYDPMKDALWVGTAKGLAHVSVPELTSLPKESFPLYVNSLEVMGDTVFTDLGSNILDRRQNHVRLHFRALSYTHPRQVEYQYRLSGVQPEWQETTDNFAEYLALAPGDYEFTVRSKISGASWGPLARVNFTILKPFWQHWYFWFGIVLVVILIAAWITRWRIRLVKLEEVQKRRTLSHINQLEQSALQASMNPHFIFNSLNAIQHILTRHKDVAGMNFVAEFATLIRKNMEFARKKAVPLDEELKHLRRYIDLEMKRLDGKFSYQIHRHLELPAEEIEIPSMIIQPFVENAIWHGLVPSTEKGQLSLTLKQENQGLEVIIQDDGVGRSQTRRNSPKSHISRGIELTRERLKMMSEQNHLEIEDLKDKEDNPTGTLVRIAIQLS